MTWFFFCFYHFSEAIIFLSLRTVSFRQQLRLLRVEKILGKHHLKNYLNEAKVVLHRQLLRFSAIPHWVFVPWLYSYILVWILGSMYWTFFSGTHIRTSVQVATQGLPVCHRDIGKREDPGDEVWSLPRKKRSYPLSQSTFRISLSTRSSISKRTIKAKHTHTHTHTPPPQKSTEFEYQNVPKAKKKKKNVWLPLQHFLIRHLHSAIYFSDWVSFNLHIMRKVLIIIHHDWFHVQR